MAKDIRQIDAHELALKLRRIVSRGIRDHLGEIEGLKIGLAKRAPRGHIVINAFVPDEFSHSALVPLLTTYLNDVANARTQGTNLTPELSFHTPLEKRVRGKTIFPLVCSIELKERILKQRVQQRDR